MNFHQQSIHKNIIVQNSPRPPRIVFLAEDSERSSKILDDIFSYSYSIWGGLRTIIVPVIEGDISKEYLEWVQLFDPDIIYTYANLKEELIQLLTKTTTPFTFKHHSYLVLQDHEDYTPNYDDLSFVDSQSLIPKMLSTPRATEINNKLYFAWSDDLYRSSTHRFFFDNFGFFDYNKLTLIKKQFSHLGILRLSVSNQEPAIKHQNEDLILNEREFLEKLFEQSGLLIFSQASLSGYDEDSQQYLRHLNYEKHEYMHSNYNIFIGDSFEDRLNFWNSRHNYSGYYSDPLELSLRLSATQIQDKDFIDSLREFLLKRVLNGRKARRIQLFSYSLSEQILTDFISKLGLKDFTHISDRHSILPIIGGERPYSSVRLSPSSETIDNQGTITINPPKHFDQLKNLTFFKENSEWISDIQLERHNILKSYYSQNKFAKRTNYKQLWRLPRNNTAAIPFLERGIHSRINYSGKIGAIANRASVTEINQIDVRSPEDMEVFQSIFNDCPTFPRNDLRYKETQDIPWYINISDKGRMFNELIEKFGGLSNAYSFLNDTFWRRVFRYLGGFESVNLCGDLPYNKFQWFVNNRAGKFPSKKKQKLYREDRKDELNYLIQQNILDQDEQNIITLIGDTKDKLKRCVHEVWLLGALLKSDIESFFYLPQTDILYDLEKPNKKNEIDFICVCNGKMIISESKTRARKFEKCLIEKLISIAMHIKADTLVLAYEKNDKNLMQLLDSIESRGIDIKLIHIFKTEHNKIRKLAREITDRQLCTLRV